MKSISFQSKEIIPFVYGIFTVLIMIFLFLSLYVITEPPQYLDIHISKEIQENQSSGLNHFMIWVSWFGRTSVSGIIVVSFSIILFLLQYKRQALLIICTLFSGAIGLFFKVIINRPRPSAKFVTLLEDTKYQSFPSGHVLFYTVFFGYLILMTISTNKLNIKMKITLIITCLAMIFIGAVSRVYLGAHWFTDVLGGFILGCILLFITGYFYLNNGVITFNNKKIK